MDLREMVKKGIFIGLVSLCALNAFSFNNLGPSTVAVDPKGDGEGYSAILYDNTRGLPTSEANAIVTTSEGFIWIGSYAGLIRYDGNTFERMGTDLGVSSVVALYVDSKGRLWVGTNDSGVAVIDKGVVHKFNRENGLRSLYIRSFTEDWQNNIYIGTTQGVAVIDPDLNVHMIDAPQINNENVRDLFFNGDGHVYGVTSTGAIFTIKQQTVTGYYDSKRLGIRAIRTICPDPKNPGYLFAGTTGSDIYYGKLTDHFEIADSMNISPLKYINNLTVFNGALWVCSDAGIGFCWDNQFIPITKVPLNTSVENMMVDYQGSLWFTSSQQGIMKIVPNQFTDIFATSHLENLVVYSTCLYDDSLFIGTKNNGLIVLKDEQQVPSVPVKKSVTASGKVCPDKDLIAMLHKQRIRSIVCDSQKRMWISTYSDHGLICYKDGYVTKYTQEDGLPTNRVRVITECQDGTILVCTSQGLAFLKDGKIVKVFKRGDLVNPDILTAVQMDNGDILAGSDGGGIYIIRGDEVFPLYTDGEPISDVILRLKRDRTRNIIWLVTSNSIGYIDENYKVTTIKQFPYANNFDLYENSRGEMWILSSNGIHVSDVNSLLKNEKQNPIFYSIDNGLPCITTANSYSELDSEGNLYIAGTTGVAKVNIEQPFETVERLKMGVPYVDVDGTIIYPDARGVFTVPSSSRKVSVNGFVFNYSLMNPMVQFRLEGFDQSSVTLKRSDFKPIHYTNLHGGRYRFIMRVLDPHGVSSKEYSVEIIKQKAFFEYIWVQVCVLVLFLALIALSVAWYINRRTRRFLKQEAEQKQLIREIVTAFSRAIDMKDRYTRGHSARVAKYTAMLTRELGYDKKVVEQYYNIALLHDIGKIGIPPEVLNKPGKLTDEEFDIIKSHSSLGYETLKDISIMPELAIGAGSHHERPDGKGYPQGLSGDQIPRVAQIIAVADTFDAMYSDRPYRPRMNFDKVVSIIKEVRGTQLATDVVDAFLRLVDKGKFRLPSDTGGGSMEDINNIRQKYEQEEGKNTGAQQNQNESEGGPKSEA